MGAGVRVIVAAGALDVGVGVSDDDGTGVLIGADVGDAELLKITLGLLLFISVTLNEPVVS